MSKLGINLGWYKHSTIEFSEYIDECLKLNIKYVRIVKVELFVVRNGG